MMHEEQEEARPKHQGWKRSSTKKLKHVKLIGRKRESGHAEPRKQALMPLGRESIPVVLSSNRKGKLASDPAL